MKKIDISDFIPPFNSGDNSYVDALTNCLNNYVEFVKDSIKLDNYIIKKIEHLNFLILSTISDLKQANAQKAYEGICKFINDEKENIGLPTYTLNNTTPLIRLRCSETDLIYRKDIFHIPYNLRHNISQQRYSITGVPCLYLSGCAFTAWLELNKPNFSNLWCAGFVATTDIKILDLAIRLDSIIEEKNSGKLIFYPLVIATSFATKHPHSPFKEEYIVSNILLQAIINHTKLKGIRYFSTKLSNYDRDTAWMASNIVLPATVGAGNYDTFLKSSFILTFPQPCATLMYSPKKGSLSCLTMPMTEIYHRDNLSEGIQHFEPKICEWYTSTQFFNIDGYIRRDLSYCPIEDS